MKYYHRVLSNFYPFSTQISFYSENNMLVLVEMSCMLCILFKT